MLCTQKTEMMKTERVQNSINNLLASKERITAAIDGPCASGKTTLAKKLSDIFDANVFHMDDFFLRPEQRTKERLSVPGGNVDYERFYDEVLSKLCDNKPFSYRPFCCKTMTLLKPVLVKPKRLNIVEGSYSMHEALRGFYDLTVFLDISPLEQKERILKRNPQNADMFFTKWIPLENMYFEECKIKEKCKIK